MIHRADAERAPTRTEQLAARGEGVRRAWPWDDRGRSAVTREGIEDDVQELWKMPGVRYYVTAGLVRI